MVKIDFSDINYIESFSDYIKFHLNNRIIVTRETITSIEAKLPKADFLRIHRSYIISISKIDSFTNEFIELDKNACHHLTRVLRLKDGDNITLFNGDGCEYSATLMCQGKKVFAREGRNPRIPQPGGGGTPPLIHPVSAREKICGRNLPAREVALSP